MIAGRHLERGSVLLEGVLMMPILFATLLTAAQLFAVQLAATRLEQAAHTLAAVLAEQPRLDQRSLSALIDQAANRQTIGNVEIVINVVSADRQLAGAPLYRGNAQGVCPTYRQGSQWRGPLPETLSPSAGARQRNMPWIVVVQVCRSSRDLALGAPLIGAKRLQASSALRMAYGPWAGMDTLPARL